MHICGQIAEIPLSAKFVGPYGEDVIAQFFAPDVQANRALIPLTCQEPGAFLFAADDFGNYYFVKAGSDAVYFWNHEGGDISELFGSFQSFWKALGQGGHSTT